MRAMGDPTSPRTLRFAITGALLLAPATGCGEDTPVEPNTVAPEVLPDPIVNEPELEPPIEEVEQPTINTPAPDPEPPAEE